MTPLYNTTLINKSFITFNLINKSSLVRSTKIDSTIKDIINNINIIEDYVTSYLLEYLNTLRILYYIKRLEYYNKEE